MVFIYENISQLIGGQAVADPGFPVGGAPSRWGGTDLRRGCFSPMARAYNGEVHLM